MRTIEISSDEYSAKQITVKGISTLRYRNVEEDYRAKRELVRSATSRLIAVDATLPRSIKSSVRSYEMSGRASARTDND